MANTMCLLKECPLSTGKLPLRGISISKTWSGVSLTGLNRASLVVQSKTDLNNRKGFIGERSVYLLLQSVVNILLPLYCRCCSVQ